MKLVEIKMITEVFRNLNNKNIFDFEKSADEDWYTYSFNEPSKGDTITLSIQQDWNHIVAIDDNGYDFEHAGGAWYVDFESDIYGYDIVNREKNSLKVLNTVVYGISDFCKEMNPGCLFFSAAEQSRIRAYNSMCKILCPTMNFELIKSKSGDYYLVNKSIDLNTISVSLDG